MTDQSPAEAESRFMVQRCVDREGIVRVLGEFPCASMEQARQEAGRLMRLIPPAARAYHAVRIEHPALPRRMRMAMERRTRLARVAEESGGPAMTAELPAAATMRQGRWQSTAILARYTRGIAAGEALTWLPRNRVAVTKSRPRNPIVTDQPKRPSETNAKSQ